MNVCIIGDGLISLTLAKALINRKINVFIYHANNKKPQNLRRTIGISPNNIDFIENNILKIKKKLLWDINKIEIYSDKKEKILNFDQSNKKLFSIINNNNLYQLLNNSLKKNNKFKKIKIKNKLFYSQILKNKKFNLIINCEANNFISNKFFYKKIYKNYKSYAYATTIKHNIIKNNKAIQIFTKYGPLAFLPISKSETSIVFSNKNKSLKIKSKLSKMEFNQLIKENNKDYKIKTINDFESFKLNSKILRNYYYKNIMMFGDNLHQIHPLSGQGFNMTLRDIKILLNLINNKEDLGLKIDNSIYEEFEKRTKHLNFLFASGNDFIYEFFSHNNNFLKFFYKNFFKYFNKNKYINDLVIKYADKGLNV
jgi:2-octaprenyl-6-methoxyphenol hydroxylase